MISYIKKSFSKLFTCNKLNPSRLQLDIIFISYDEEEADKNFKHLKSFYPNAKRVSGVKGIRNAHKKASELALTNFFFTIDGDNRFIENHYLKIPTDLDSNTVYVWRCQNAVNDLVYGYGGLKLWPKSVFKEELHTFKDHAMDSTTHYQVIHDLVTTTYFNTSDFYSWRSGFRESIKLQDNISKNKDKVSQARLETWLTKGANRRHGKSCLLGSQMGQAFYQEHGEKASYDLINDFDKIKKFYQQKQIQA